jgi:hypothetical protein
MERVHIKQYTQRFWFSANGEISFLSDKGILFSEPEGPKEGMSELFRTYVQNIHQGFCSG